MIKRVVAFGVVAVLAAGCSSAPTADLNLGQGLRFVPEVIDSSKDVGQSPSIVLDSEGRPLIAYLGFEQVLGEGDIAEERLLHLPAVPNVLFADTSEEGYWQIGSVAWNRETGSLPTGDPELQSRDEEGKALEPVANASVAAAATGDGDVSVAWSQKGSLEYAPDSGDAFTGQTVTRGETWGVSMAMATDGTPWIAYYRGNRVEAATMDGGRWVTRPVGSARLSPDVTAARTAIVVQGDTPVVAYTDGDSPVLAELGPDENEVANRVVEPRGGGFGISLAAAEGSDLVLSYYTAAGGVRHAHGPADGPFDISEIAPDPTGGEGSVFGWATGTATAGDGSDFVTWYDLATDSVKLAHHVDGKVEAVDTNGTRGGTSPTITIAEGDLPMVAWYDAVNQNLSFGKVVPADAKVAVAVPSPSPVSETVAAPTEEACEPTVLDVSAPTNAASVGFEPTCLAAKADKPFTIAFANDDAAPHNVAVFTDPSASKPIFENTEAVNPGASATYKIDGQKPGTYFFNCFFHPTTMTGSLVVA